MWFVLGKSVLSWKDRTLEMRASRVRALITSIPQLPSETLATRLDELVGILPEGQLIQIFDHQGHRLFPTQSVPEFSITAQVCIQPTIRNVSLDQKYFRVLCRPLEYEGHQAFLLIPSSLLEDQILSRNLTTTLLGMAPFLLILSGIGGYALSRRALRPVDHLITEAQTITAKDLSRRLPVPDTDDEMRRLALAWNSLLVRIETAMKKIEQFTADASHELRSPIAFIRATAQERLYHGNHDPETREAFEAIVEETRAAGELLESLLTLARADAGFRPGQPGTISLEEAILDVCSRFKSLVGSKRQEIYLPDFAYGTWMVRIEEVHFRRLLSILLDNAIKYTPSGGTITVACALGDALYVRVTDTGCGIAQEHLPRVFDRFYRVDSARTEAGDGTGLGLCIAKWLAELYLGEVQLESQPGVGTSAILILPLSLVAHEG